MVWFGFVDAGMSSRVLSVVDQIEEDPESEDVRDMSWLLYDSAITASGFQVCIKRR